ncbi:Cyclin H-like [Carpediemonas membranifera]|uniref:Cyclin H-like n=1 Tax=Carpediemonas membranifera TaxID=201153 RepID=A0A8J6ARI0_9EUKA|nr:Cyclin H-like [Carpediemonas membranifera]|eukprot:KAG9392446.1 Cyclin H-like [Carpediemonas membranifera]
MTSAPEHQRKSPCSNWVFDFEELYYLSGGRNPNDELRPDLPKRIPLSYEEEQELLSEYCRLIRKICAKRKLGDKITILAMLLLRRYYTDPRSVDLARREHAPSDMNPVSRDMPSAAEAQWYSGFVTVFAALWVAQKTYDRFKEVKVSSFWELLLEFAGKIHVPSFKYSKTHWHNVLRRERHLALTVNFDLILMPDMHVDALFKLVNSELVKLPRLLEKIVEKNTAEKYCRVNAERTAEAALLRGPIHAARNELCKAAHPLLLEVHQETDLFLRFYPLEVYYAILIHILAVVPKHKVPRSVAMLREASYTEITAIQGMPHAKASHGTHNAAIRGYDRDGRALLSSDEEWQGMLAEQLMPVIEGLWAAMRVSPGESKAPPEPQKEAEGPSQPMEPTPQIDLTQQTDHTEQTEIAQQTDETEQTQQTDQVELSGQAEEPDPTQETEQPELTEQTQQAEFTERTEQTEPMDQPMDEADSQAVQQPEITEE